MTTKKTTKTTTKRTTLKQPGVDNKKIKHKRKAVIYDDHSIETDNDTDGRGQEFQRLNLTELRSESVCQSRCSGNLRSTSYTIQRSVLEFSLGCLFEDEIVDYKGKSGSTVCMTISPF
ncbi:hypothetical protein CHS0354_012326 [Potamilus streckersoni]|uniref:Uncharacterized protein n=1 Tax=Potamilus streckersoni TaxID=2493646 RepID=A0AAE0SK75_9BIVA|nr:hypothetical protein CHS0354_012326 [Potamilus streckersoni]